MSATSAPGMDGIHVPHTPHTPAHATPHHHLGPPPAPMSHNRPILVLKVGTSSLVDPDTQQPKISYMSRLCEATASLQRAGYSVVIVSSGAVGLGAARMGFKEKPKSLSGKQAAAAIGQVRLMALWDQMLSTIGGIPCAQCLLSAHDFGDRTLYLNARNTLVELLKMGAVPIINENDTTAVVELRVGDNDTLSALVAAMLSSELLFLFTDVDSLYDANPRQDKTAAPIKQVPAAAIAGLRRQMLTGAPKLSVDAALASSSAASLLPSPSPLPATPADQGSAGTAFGTGGMATKLKAAQLASAAGVTTVITHTNRVEEITAELVKVSAALAHPHHPLPSPASSYSLATAGAAGSGPSSSPPAGAGTTGGMKHSGSSSNNLDQKASAAAAGSGTPLPGATAAAAGTAGAIAINAPLPPANAASSLFSSPTASVFSFGTTFLPYAKPISGRKRWILALPPAGQIVLDAGAVAAVVDARKSLFPAGIKEVKGDFESQVDAVSLVDEAGNEVARALVNYSTEEIKKIRGKRSQEIYLLLGYPGPEAVADRDNIVLLTLQQPSSAAGATPAAGLPRPASRGGSPSAAAAGAGRRGSSGASASSGGIALAAAIATAEASIVADSAPTPSI
jgi:glutamate 5-kinase